MIKLSPSKLILNFFASLFWIIGFLFCGTFTQVHATTEISYLEKPISNLDIEQNRTISGKVISAEDNMSVPGVNVIVKGTSKGTVTDFDGNFSINVPSNESVIIFSYLGYVTQEITVGKNNTIHVTLQTDLAALDEVVVVAYGIAKKETLTGSIEQVKAEAFEDLAVGSTALALQGRTPGLVITRNSSRPGDEDINFLVRGVSSINGISPLIVIDGVPTINDASFNDMNPNDIESISVLKGGAASVYGSRAAGGVILVTTKKGKGDVKIEISSILRVGTIGIRPPTPTMQEWGALWLAATSQDETPNFGFWLGTENLERFAAGEEGIYHFTNFLGDVYVSDSNRFDEMFGNSYSNQHNISVSGGSEKSNFRMAAGYDENVGGLKVADDSRDRYNFSLNYGVNVSERLKLSTNISYFHTSFSGPSGGLDREATTIDPPIFASKNQFGQWYANFGGNIAGGRNAVARVIDGGRENNIDKQLRLTTSIEYKLTDNLNITGSYSYSDQDSEDQIYHLTVPTYNWFGDVAPAQINGTSYIQETTDRITYKNYKASLNYSNNIGNHNLSGLLAIEADRNTNKRLRARRNGFVDYGVYDLAIGSEDLAVTTFGGGNTWGFFGYIGRINYDYKGKYLLELQGRRDGSSRFAKGQKWSNYGNVSTGWVLSSENFLKNSNVVSFLKIRGGYGELGSTAGIDEFGYLSTVALNTIPNIDSIKSRITVFGATAAQQGNSSGSNLFSTTTTWERIVSKEIGVDFKLFNNKVFGAIDFFNKKNIGMLIQRQIPATIAPLAPYTNSGTLESKGWEVVLGYANTFGDFNVSVSANMSDSRNKVTSFFSEDNFGGVPVAGLNAADDSEIIEGKPINSFYMWETDGFFANQAEVDTYYSSLKPGGELPSQTSTGALRPGDTRVVDTNKDGTIDSEDLTYQGDALPHHVYGFNFDIKYKSFDFSAFFQGALNHKILRTGFFASPFQQVWQNQSNTWLGRTWTEDNPNAEFPRLTTISPLAAWNYTNKDFMLQNNRYIRLKSLILGYNIKDLKMGNTLINTLRIYFSGNDLFEWSQVKDGWDPESRADTNASAYPFMRTWALGVKVSL
ncbi:SusC/RagA family TonB-linked outer membrane protein [Flavivirga jejuensis]|uniref:TonB-dependent receptor n=1 Tax=Flavivirga jejuensis TaxID=870487 RepID=A0ABT8WPL9_9FLAO|nr:TonB-dependent receptor [Flavivirga jejuensis]MDO5975110.1 TonB-dependent receptor [Flavivirga jejuensis]